MEGVDHKDRLAATQTMIDSQEILQMGGVDHRDRLTGTQTTVIRNGATTRYDLSAVLRWKHYRTGQITTKKSRIWKDVMRRVSRCFQVADPMTLRDPTVVGRSTGDSRAISRRTARTSSTQIQTAKISR